MLVPLFVFRSVLQSLRVSRCLTLSCRFWRSLSISEERCLDGWASEMTAYFGTAGQRRTVSWPDEINQRKASPNDSVPGQDGGAGRRRM